MGGPEYVRTPSTCGRRRIGRPDLGRDVVTGGTPLGVIPQEPGVSGVPKTYEGNLWIFEVFTDRCQKTGVRHLSEGPTTDTSLGTKRPSPSQSERGRHFSSEVGDKQKPRPRRPSRTSATVSRRTFERGECRCEWSPSRVTCRSTTDPFVSARTRTGPRERSRTGRGPNVLHRRGQESIRGRRRIRGCDTVYSGTKEESTQTGLRESCSRPLPNVPGPPRLPSRPLSSYPLDRTGTARRGPSQTTFEFRPTRVEPGWTLEVPPTQS